MATIKVANTNYMYYAIYYNTVPGEKTGDSKTKKYCNLGVMARKQL